MELPTTSLCHFLRAQCVSILSFIIDSVTSLLNKWTFLRKLTLPIIPIRRWSVCKCLHFNYQMSSLIATMLKFNVTTNYFSSSFAGIKGVSIFCWISLPSVLIFWNFLYNTTILLILIRRILVCKYLYLNYNNIYLITKISKKNFNKLYFISLCSGVQTVSLVKFLNV